MAVNQFAEITIITPNLFDRAELVMHSPKTGYFSLWGRTSQLNQTAQARINFYPERQCDVELDIYYSQQFWTSGIINGNYTGSLQFTDPSNTSRVLQIPNSVIHQNTIPQFVSTCDYKRKLKISSSDIILFQKNYDASDTADSTFVLNIDFKYL